MSNTRKLPRTATHRPAVQRRRYQHDSLRALDLFSGFGGLTALANLTLEECYFRMMAAHEIGRGCGFDVNFGDYQGTYIVWGSARDQVDGYGNAVTPAVGEWIGGRLLPVLHRQEVA